MKIKEFVIHYFRSICHLEMSCEDLIVLLGPNNHGKSNILSAIEFALSTSFTLKQSDLNALCGDDKTLWVEITFHELTDQEKKTFKKYVNSDGTICIRKTGMFLNEEKIIPSYNGYVEEPNEPWLKSDNIKELTNREKINETSLRDLIEPTGRVTKQMVIDAQYRYIEEHRDELEFNITLEKAPLLGQKNVAAGVLPDFYLIPAVRDLSEEMKTRGKTTFNRLLSRAVQEMAERDPRFSELKDELKKLINKLNRTDRDLDERPDQLKSLEQNIQDELGQWGVDVEIKIEPPEIDKIFETKTNMFMDDGVKTRVENKGHGLQRAVIFALIRAWTRVLRTVHEEAIDTSPRASSESVIFAIEEPEIFLHPHAQRTFSRSIKELSKNAEHQVFICSHSSHFVDMDNYRSICVVYKNSPSEGTQVRQCKEDLFEGESNKERKRRFHMAHWVNPDRGEMFFAKRVAFVEGETERTIFPFLGEKMECLDHEVSVVDCGSKFNLPLYISIANAFNIPYIVVHDEDPLPAQIPLDWYENNKLRGKTRTFEFNQEIRDSVNTTFGKVEMFSPDFEGEAGISRRAGENKGKALAALDFFEDLDVSELPQRIQDVVNFIYCSRGVENSS